MPAATRPAAWKTLPFRREPGRLGAVARVFRTLPLLAALVLCGLGFAPAAWGRGVETRVGVFWANYDDLAPGLATQAVETASEKCGCGYEVASGQGLWLNHDPIGEAGGLNLYGYVGNDPINSYDPVGLYELSYGKSVSEKEQIILNAELVNVQNKAHQLREEIQNMFTQELNRKTACGECFEALRNELSIISWYLQKVENGIAGKSEKLDVIKTSIGKGANLAQIRLRSFFPNRLELDKNVDFTKDNNFRANELGQTLLHEFTHLYGADDFYTDTKSAPNYFTWASDSEIYNQLWDGVRRFYGKTISKCKASPNDSSFLLKYPGSDLTDLTGGWPDILFRQEIESSMLRGYDHL